MGSDGSDGDYKPVKDEYNPRCHPGSKKKFDWDKVRKKKKAQRVARRKNRK